MNIVFRVDSSDIIGIGHVMRCLTLADGLRKERKASIKFFSRNSKGSICSLTRKKGFDCILMEPAKKIKASGLYYGEWLGETQKEDFREFNELLENQKIDSIDLLVIDHYGIDSQWENLAKNKAKKILVIDDLADRQHVCDYLLDQSFNCKPEKYASLVSSETKLLLGTEYVLLREEFNIDTVEILNVRAESNRTELLVMFGGTDPDNLTLKILRQISKRKDIDKVVVVLGPTSKYKIEVSNYCDEFKHFKLKISPNNIAELMLRASIAIGASGTVSWERCSTGLPAVVIIQAENQKQVARELELHGAIKVLDNNAIDNALNEQLDHFIYQTQLYKDAVSNCLRVCDGAGTERVLRAVLD